MNRFEYADPQFLPNEEFIRKDTVIRLYDGDTKTNFEKGDLVLTTHRLLWAKPLDISFGRVCLALWLRYVIFFEEETAAAMLLGRSMKVVCHLSEASIDKMPGPLDNSKCNYIKLSFKQGLNSEFLKLFADTIMRRVWESVPSTSMMLPQIKPRTGIIGIERNLQERQKATDNHITMAFQDLKKLMEKAKDMVALSKTISAKIRERQGDITEDETVRFKSYLMSLGIDDPVTRDAYKSSNGYFKHLAKELAQILEEPIKEVGGMMTLTDVYCRVNRARGLQLLSPEDLLNASKLLIPLDLPIVLRTFDSGVMVLQIKSQNDEAISNLIADLLKEKGSMTVEELAQSEGISVLLARERLLVTENNGKACRDDSIEALRFYPNLFLEEANTLEL